MFEFADKFYDRSNRDVPKLIDTVDDWLFGDRPILFERYLNGWLHIHIHIRCRFAELDAEHFCAVLGGPCGPLGIRATDNLSVRLAGVNTELKDGHVRNDDYEQFMLVGHVHVVQDPQRMPLETFAVVVGLQRLDDICCGGGDTAYFSPVTGLFKFLRPVADREFVPIAGGSAIYDNELGDKMVQGRPALVNDLSGNDGKPKRRLWADDAKNMLSCVVVWLTNDGVSVAVQKISDVTIEILDVLIDPLDLGPDTVEGM